MVQHDEWNTVLSQRIKRVKMYITSMLYKSFSSSRNTCVSYIWRNRCAFLPISPLDQPCAFNLDFQRLQRPSSLTQSISPKKTSPRRPTSLMYQIPTPRAKCVDDAEQRRSNNKTSEEDEKIAENNNCKIRGYSGIHQAGNLCRRHLGPDRSRSQSIPILLF